MEESIQLELLQSQTDVAEALSGKSTNVSNMGSLNASNMGSHKSLTTPSLSIWTGIKNCFILLTTPKFMLLTFTMFANGTPASCSSLGYIALFVPSQMNRQIHDSTSVGLYMALYARTVSR